MNTFFRLEAPDTLPLSSLNALEYCPRRFYYEYVQGDMLTNEFVLEGTLLHERADEPRQHMTEDGEVRITHLYLVSEALHLSGFADVVQTQQGIPIPVEYKHGKEGRWLNDHVQLCAQAFCLEERLSLSQPIPYGSIFYFGSRKRIQVAFTDELRAKTRATIERAFRLATMPSSPPPLEGKLARRCQDCSLRPICLPDEVLLLMKRKGDLHANALFD